MANIVSSNLKPFPILTRFSPQAMGKARLAAASSLAGEGNRMALWGTPGRGLLSPLDLGVSESGG
ncbi:MAG TPA: hypothetical protein VFE27_09195 [Acidobacteriaceae bacterium]|jgi:hypothetical protein|nr:hypothetical protein [Acidobacteriaceae bacterium]